MGVQRKIRRPNFSPTVVSLYTSDGKNISNLRGYILDKINGKKLIDYYEERRGWKSSEISEIEWEGINGMLKTAGHMRRITLIKMLHNWQNTGRQKGKMRDARLYQNAEVPKVPTEEELTCHLCPEGCGEEEKELHYLECPTEKMKKERGKLLNTVLKRLKELHTYEGTTSIIGYVLGKISEREEIDIGVLNTGSFDKKTPDSLRGTGENRMESNVPRLLPCGMVRNTTTTLRTEGYKYKKEQH